MFHSGSLVLQVLWIYSRDEGRWSHGQLSLLKKQTKQAFSLQNSLVTWLDSCIRLISWRLWYEAFPKCFDPSTFSAWSILGIFVSPRIYFWDSLKWLQRIWKQFGSRRVMEQTGNWSQSRAEPPAVKKRQLLPREGTGTGGKEVGLPWAEQLHKSRKRKTRPS